MRVAATSRLPSRKRALAGSVELPERRARSGGAVHIVIKRSDARGLPAMRIGGHKLSAVNKYVPDNIGSRAANLQAFVYRTRPGRCASIPLASPEGVVGDHVIDASSSLDHAVAQADAIYHDVVKGVERPGIVVPVVAWTVRFQVDPRRPAARALISVEHVIV